jgi:DNA-binding transcriptional LysR family regulator
MDLTGFRHVRIAGVQLIPVAAPSHPLASANIAAQPRARDFVQLVLSEEPVGEGRDFGVVSLNTWRVGDLNAKHRLVVGGVGLGLNAGAGGSR